MSSIATTPPTRETYTPALIAIHWLTVLLIAAVFATIELREYFPKGSETRDQLKALHFMLGLTVWLFVLVRLVLRSREHTPQIVPPPSAWQMAAAHVMHALLYAVMIAMPVLGWLVLSGEGKPVPFFGLTLPPLIAENKDLAHQIEDVHVFIGDAFYYLIGLHALAALAHHYLTKDNTLTRMLPYIR
ncbi:cytochrome B561 [Hyphomicrobium denitrificans 1NES1]|uniref:Cytochrome B561 n=1 Tax=Hyphomicrobium denitrificans 1NES1 TaxID=670307 RepID=N0B5P2_9HYPH|nr:cytochrome b [Hyphomicrobium denitrificans]AGK58343.1 cytochrome B561 [Hyphomicrobium denitrificans 1NES1]